MGTQTNPVAALTSNTVPIASIRIQGVTGRRSALTAEAVIHVAKLRQQPRISRTMAGTCGAGWSVPQSPVPPSMLSLHFIAAADDRHGNRIADVGCHAKGECDRSQPGPVGVFIRRTQKEMARPNKGSAAPSLLKLVHCCGCKSDPAAEHLLRSPRRSHHLRGQRMQLCAVR